MRLGLGARFLGRGIILLRLIRSEEVLVESKSMTFDVAKRSIDST